MKTTSNTSVSAAPLLTKVESAKLLRICVRKLELMIQARQIAVIRIGRAVRIELTELERLKANLTVTAVG